MRQSKFTETQIVSMLKEADVGRPVNEIWRKYGISSATYYKWKAKYGGLEASDIKRLKELEHENSRLKRLYADLSLENAALKDVIAKKLYGPPSGGRLPPIWSPRAAFRFSGPVERAAWAGPRTIGPGWSGRAAMRR
jgi:putative transposase